MKKLSSSEKNVLQQIILEVRSKMVKSEFDSTELVYIDNGDIILSFSEEEYHALQSLYLKVYDLPSN